MADAPRWVVGIAGGSASGKSLLARAVVEALAPTAVTHVLHDDYYRTIPAELAHRPGDVNFDHPDALETDLLAEHVAAWRRGETVAMPRYDFATHTRVAHVEVAPQAVLLVEGILLLTEPALRDALDLAVFVEAPTDVRRARRLARDVAERGREPAWILDRFARHVEPMHQEHVVPTAAHAHLIVDGTAPVPHNVAQVLARAPGTLRGR